MRECIVAGRPLSHRLAVKRAFELGLEAHGEKFDDGPPVTWGVSNHGHYLCLEAGNVTAIDGEYEKRRLARISASWGGYGYRGAIPKVASQRFEIECQPWKDGGEYALLLCQMPRDRILPSDYEKWLASMTVELKRRSQMVYRPHPCVEQRSVTLAEDLAGAEYAVTYCSNSAVEAVLAGVPTICFDRSCAAWPVCSKMLGLIQRPDRSQWLAELSWRNWTLDEIASGLMWDFLKEFENADRSDCRRGDREPRSSQAAFANHV